MQGSGFRLRGLGFRVQGLLFGVFFPPAQLTMSPFSKGGMCLIPDLLWSLCCSSDEFPTVQGLGFGVSGFRV